MDEIIVFRQLTKKEVKQIADIFLKVCVGVWQLTLGNANAIQVLLSSSSLACLLDMIEVI